MFFYFKQLMKFRVLLKARNLAKAIIPPQRKDILFILSGILGQIDRNIFSNSK